MIWTKQEINRVSTVMKRNYETIFNSIIGKIGTQKYSYNADSYVGHSVCVVFTTKLKRPKFLGSTKE